MRFSLAGLSAVAGVAMPTAAFAVDYLSPDQAAQALFPEADRFEAHEWVLDAAQMQTLGARGIDARSERWAVRMAWRGRQALGWVVLDAVVGKFELIRYAVGIDAGGAVRQVEVLSYSESHGGEVRLPAWRRQFVGKTAASPLRLGDDIASISGATLSCSHLTDGVRRIVAIVDLLRREGRP